MIAPWERRTYSLKHLFASVAFCGLLLCVASFFNRENARLEITEVRIQGARKIASYVVVHRSGASAGAVDLPAAVTIELGAQIEGAVVHIQCRTSSYLWLNQDVHEVAKATILQLATENYDEIKGVGSKN